MKCGHCKKAPAIVVVTFAGGKARTARCGPCGTKGLGGVVKVEALP